MTKAFASFVPDEGTKLVKAKEQKHNSIEDRKRYISRNCDYIRDCIRKIQDYEQSTGLYQHDIVQFTQEIAEIDAQLALIKPNTAKIEREMRRIKEHPYIKNVRIKSGILTLITAPLFTDIRIKTNSRKKRHTFLGVYEIQLWLNDREIRLTNLSFPSRAHWGASGSGKVCQGTWEPAFRDARDRGNWSQYITTLITCLKSTEDGAAYMPSHDWRDNQRQIIDNTRLCDWYWIKLDEDGGSREGMAQAKFSSGQFVWRDGETVVDYIVEHKRMPDFVSQILDKTDEEIKQLVDAHYAKNDTARVLALLDNMTDEVAETHYELLNKSVTFDIADILEPNLLNHESTN